MSLENLRRKATFMVNILPEKELFAVEKFIEFISSQIEDPVLRMLLMAPPDNEPLSEDTESVIKESMKSYHDGDVIDFEEFAKEIPDGE